MLETIIGIIAGIVLLVFGIVWLTAKVQRQVHKVEECD